MSEQLWDDKTTGFGPKTIIETTDGPVPAEWLSTTHYVVTRDNGPQPVLSVDQHVLQSLDGDYLPLLEIAADAMHEAAPDYPLLLPPHHRILLEGAEIELHFGLDTALCHVADLLDGRRIRRRNLSGPVTFYSFLLPGHEVIKANCLWVETKEVRAGCDHVALNTLSPDIFAKLQLQHGAHRVAHPCLAPWEGRLLARQHANTAPLYLTDVA